MRLSTLLFLVTILPACGGTQDLTTYIGSGEPDSAGSADDQATEAAKLSAVSTIVKTSSGRIQGGLNSRSRFFLGIPYAAPPTGELRWRPTTPHPGWSGVRSATSFGNFCPQAAPALAPPPDGLVASEDCLSLNIWTPWPVQAKAPVMIFIHGGGFVQGYSATPTYNGQELAERSGVIVVNFNYRLGVLGFLSHPVLGTESGLSGLLDQQAAMRWVKQNIAAFGGDPNNVTIFGESAGGFSVSTHLVAPDSQGLFQRAISQSGPAAWLLPTLTEAYQQGEDLAVAVDCAAGSTVDPATCLRNVSAEDLIKALPNCVAMLYGEGYMWMPPVNGTTIPDQPLRLLEQGRFAQVPVLFGTNQDEGSLFALAPMMADGEVTKDDVISDDQYRQIVLETFGEALYPTIYEMYDPAKYATGLLLSGPTGALSDLLGDWYFNCPTRRTMRAISRWQNSAVSASKAFLYRFTWKPTLGAFALLGSHHGAELPFVFGHLTDAMPMVAYRPTDKVISDAMINLWTSFAKTGNPNTSLLPTTNWPEYDLIGEKHLILDRQLAQGDHLEQAQCDFWDNLGVYDTP